MDWKMTYEDGSVKYASHSRLLSRGRRLFMKYVRNIAGTYDCVVQTECLVEGIYEITNKRSFVCFTAYDAHRKCEEMGLQIAH